MSKLSKILDLAPFEIKREERDAVVSDLLCDDENEIQYYSIENDKKNMKDDFNNVKDDFNTAFLSYKKEHCICDTL